MWADENAPTFEFLIENGVIFNDVAPTIVNGGTVPRLFITKPFSDNLNETINGSPGSGLMRNLEASAKAKGATFCFAAQDDPYLAREPIEGRAVGITAVFEGKESTSRRGEASSSRAAATPLTWIFAGCSIPGSRKSIKRRRALDPADG